MIIKDHSGIALDNSTLHEISAVISKGFGRVETTYRVVAKVEGCLVGQ